MVLIYYWFSIILFRFMCEIFANMLSLKIYLLKPHICMVIKPFYDKFLKCSWYKLKIKLRYKTMRCVNRKALRCFFPKHSTNHDARAKLPFNLCRNFHLNKSKPLKLLKRLVCRFKCNFLSIKPKKTHWKLLLCSHVVCLDDWAECAGSR